MPENQSSINLPLIVLGLVAAAALGLAVLVIGGAFFGGFPVAQTTGEGGLAVGERAPEIRAEGWINGEPPSLDGKVVVVEAWSST